MGAGTISFPKLLVVTAFAPNPVGGALVRQLLRGYPADRLHWWTCASEEAGGHALETNQLHYCPIPSRLQPHRRLVRLKSWLVENVWMARLASSLRRTTKEVRPDVVWCQLTGWVIPAFWRAGLLGRVHTHTSLWDYHNSFVHFRQFGKRRAQRLARLSEQILVRSSTCDVISEPMRSDIAARTGRSDVIIVHSGFEPWQIKRLAEAEPAPTASIRIAYTGSIIAPATFELFVRALRALRSQLPRPVSLELFSRSFRGEPWFDRAWMTDHGLLDEPSFLRELDGCSWGFAPMNLADDDPAYNRYSFPNKFGTSLAAGLPLIVLAHRQSSAARMIQVHPVGVCSDATELDGLVGFLGRALAEENPRKLYRDRILHCARTEFDAEEMRRRLWSCLGVN
jgi:hypothetical protein